MKDGIAAKASTDPCQRSIGEVGEDEQGKRGDCPAAAPPSLGQAELRAQAHSPARLLRALPSRQRNGPA
jgi:hypothetical protein